MEVNRFRVVPRFGRTCGCCCCCGRSDAEESCLETCLSSAGGGGIGEGRMLAGGSLSFRRLNLSNRNGKMELRRAAREKRNMLEKTDHIEPLSLHRLLQKTASKGCARAEAYAAGAREDATRTSLQPSTGVQVKLYRSDGS